MKMSTSVLLILVVIGIITGFMAGMLGIGGAIIMIPALVYSSGINPARCPGNQSCCHASSHWYNCSI